MLAKSLSFHCFFYIIGEVGPVHGEMLHLGGVVSNLSKSSLTILASADEYLLSQDHRQADDLRTDVSLKQGQNNSSGEKSYSHNLILKNLGCNNYGNPGSNI